MVQLPGYFMRMAASGALLLACAAAQADTNFSCAHGIVSIGDSSYVVAKKCGEPQGKENAAGGGAKVTLENWFYGGGSKLNYRFTFRAGSLIEIEHMGQ